MRTQPATTQHPFDIEARALAVVSMEAAAQALAQHRAIRVSEPLPVGVVEFEIGGITLQRGDMRDKRRDADAPRDQDVSPSA